MTTPVTTHRSQLADTFLDTGLEAALEIGPTRQRTAPRPPETPFGSVLRGGAELALQGASLALGPILGGAVRQAMPAAGVAPGNENPTLDQMRALQEDSQAFNLQYLELQENVQEENRRYSAISNVLKARHETAKSAIANLRA